MKTIIFQNYFHLQKFKLLVNMLKAKKRKKINTKKIQKKKKKIAKEKSARRNGEKSMCRCLICITSNTTRASIEKNRIGNIKKSRKRS